VDSIEAAFKRGVERASGGPARLERRMAALVAPDVPTFLESERIEPGASLDGYGAVFVGAPFEGVLSRDPRTFLPQGTAGPVGQPGYARGGAFDAPHAVRRGSLFYSLDHSAGLFPEMDVAISDRITVGDAGNCGSGHEPPLDADRLTRPVVAAIAGAGAVPLTCGGDHLVPWFTVSGIHEARAGRIGVLTFDSHLDLGWEPRYWAGSQWARLLESGAIRPQNLVHVGIRGTRNPRHWLYTAEELGLHWYSMAEVQRRGPDVVVAEALERALDGCDLLYVSLDVDSIDPAFCPGQKYPEPAGFTAQEIVWAIRTAADRPELCGFDACCFGPAYDVNEQGAMLIARCFVEAVAGVAKGDRRQATGYRG